MTQVEDATTDGESRSFTSDRSECPECGGGVYYEPRITNGTQYEPTGGHACLDCSWTQIDPDSADPRPRAARTANRVNTLENATCDECRNDEFEATYQKQPSADPASNFVAVPVIACTECGAVVVREPGPDVFEVFDK